MNRTRYFVTLDQKYAAARIARPVRVYRVRDTGSAMASLTSASRRWRFPTSRRSRCSRSRTGQLIDAATGRHLWADRFGGLIEDVFELQDKVASSVAGIIEPALQAAEMRRSATRPTTDLTAYDLYLRAVAAFYQ